MEAKNGNDTCIRTIDVQSRCCVESVTFSPDGQYLASGSSDSTVKLWCVETGECTRTMEGHNHVVNSVAFSPDGQYLASGSRDKTVKLWHVESGECTRTMEGHSYGVYSVAFSPNGQYLASGSYDSTIKLWKSNKLLGIEQGRERMYTFLNCMIKKYNAFYNKIDTEGQLNIILKMFSFYDPNFLS